jgi:hypothetical protein
MTDTHDTAPPADQVAAAQIRNTVGLANEDEMAATLQVSHETLATWRTKKRGPPSIKLGKKVFYLIPDFGRWVMEEVERQQLTSRIRDYEPRPELPPPADGVLCQLPVA